MIYDARTKRPFSAARQRLKEAGLRSTRQRLALARLLFEQGDRHITAETLYGEAGEAGIRVSLATIYNTLNQFTEAGLLREVVIAAGRSYFDTNLTDHHHFYYEENGHIEDIAEDGIQVSGVPTPPAGTKIDRVDIVVRIRAQQET